MLSNAVLYVLILYRFYNVTSLVHFYIVIIVFLGLASWLLLVHLALVPFSPFPLPTYLFCHSVI